MSKKILMSFSYSLRTEFNRKTHGVESLQYEKHKTR